MSPFVSKAQRRFMFEVHPKLAREFAHKTKNMKKLPEKLHRDLKVKKNTY